MTDAMATDPQPTPEPELEPEVAPEAPEAEGTPPETPEAPEVPEDLEVPELDQLPEMVEVEYMGSKYRVDPALKDAVMMHADYTRKTQEIADTGRALESEREAFGQQVEAHRQNLQDFGQLAYMDQVLQQFDTVNWQDVQQQDPEKAQELAFQFQMAQRQRQQIVERLQKSEHDARLQAQREYAKQKEQLQATLARDIPNYSPELQTKMTQTAISQGFTQQEVEALTDPRYARMLHLAHLGEQVLKRQAAAAKSKPTEPVKPVPKAGGGRPPASGPKDEQGIDDWMKRRNKELRTRTA